MGGQSAIDMEEYAYAETVQNKKDDVSVGNIEELVKTALSNNPALRGFKVEVKGREVDENGHVLVNCVASPPPQATEIDVVIGPDGETKEEAYDMEEYSGEAGQTKEEKPAGAAVPAKEETSCHPGTDEPEEGQEAQKEASVGEILLPYMRKCLYSIVDIISDEKMDMAEKTRQLDTHMAAVCMIAFDFGRTGKCPDTLEILDDGTVVPKRKEA